MCPEDVSHEERGPGHELLLAEAAQFPAREAVHEVVQAGPVQTELPHCPVDPVGHLVPAPAPRVPRYAQPPAVSVPAAVCCLQHVREDVVDLRVLLRLVPGHAGHSPVLLLLPLYCPVVMSGLTVHIHLPGWSWQDRCAVTGCGESCRGEVRGERCARCDGLTATAGSPDTQEGRVGRDRGEMFSRGSSLSLSLSLSLSHHL